LTFSTSSIQREVIQAQGQRGSNQKSGVVEAVAGESVIDGSTPGGPRLFLGAQVGAWVAGGPAAPIRGNVERMFVAAGAWDDGLDDAQMAAATHGDGPLVVMAGAGTGKTRALTARVAWLLERGVAAEKILLLTFTRRAADDMLARAVALIGAEPGRRRPRGGTFHAVAHGDVAAHAGSLGLPHSFTVLDPGEAADLMDLLRGQHGPVETTLGTTAGTTVRMPRSATLVEAYSRCINTQRPLREVLAVDYPWCEPHLEEMAELFRAFTARKRAAGLVDFDDLLLYWRALLGHDELGSHLAGRFEHVLVDEYQDVNTLQVDIVRSLRPEGRGLTVVGDDAQAIYGFRGADARHLHDVAERWPDTTVLRLEHNFRSRQSILDLANAVRPAENGRALQLYSDRPPGSRPLLVRCHDAPAEARAVADAVLEAHERGVALREQAVLVRAAHHSDLVEIELSVRRIPYRKYGGLRFLEAAHVKDFVTAARLLDNPHDEIAWFRLLRLHQGIGPARARALVAMLQPGIDDVLPHWPDAVAAAPAATRSALSATLDGLSAARRRTTPGERAEAVLAVLRPLALARYPDAAIRLGDLERLVATAATVADLQGWLAELTLDPPRSTGHLAGPPHLDEDYLVLSTIHSAKGLEWSIVHLPHLVDGAFPSDMALTSPAGLAEERRLFYVATTRARDELRMYTPLRMPHHRHGRDDRHSFAPASRFLDAAALATMEIEELSPAREPVPAGPPASVEVDLAPLWR
jgi:DNA helicase-2/ATP-dependent DNA helicase PcrA